MATSPKLANGVSSHFSSHYSHTKYTQRAVNNRRKNIAPPTAVIFIGGTMLGSGVHCLLIVSSGQTPLSILLQRIFFI